MHMKVGHFPLTNHPAPANLLSEFDPETDSVKLFLCFVVIVVVMMLRRMVFGKLTNEINLKMCVAHPTCVFRESAWSPPLYQ